MDLIDIPHGDNCACLVCKHKRKLLRMGYRIVDGEWVDKDAVPAPLPASMLGPR